MTEMVAQNGVSSQNQDNSNSAVDSSPPITQPSPRVYSQEQVNEIAAGIKKETSEKTYKKALEEFSNQQQLTQAHEANQPTNSQKTAKHLGADEVAKIAAESAASQFMAQQDKRNQEQVAAQKFSELQKLANELETKCKESKSYPELSQHIANVGNFDGCGIGEALKEANEVANTDGVLNELATNTTKLKQISEICAMGNPRLVKKVIKDLSKSIADNSKPYQGSPAPFSQVKPSNVGMNNGNIPGLQDLKSDPAFR